MKSQFKQCLKNAFHRVGLEVRRTNQEDSEPVTCGEFEDRFGNRFLLYKDFRSCVRPNWREFFRSHDADVSVPDWLITNAIDDVTHTKTLLNNLGFSLNGAHVLELGSGSGLRSLALAHAGAGRVLATDLDAYWAQEQLSTCEAPRIERLRREALQRFESTHGSATTSRVTFAQLDITDTHAFEGSDESFDLIVSFETLEHIQDPSQAFHNIGRLLSDGGVTYHRYNPFFCFSGGHSPCTLDFPFGHAALSNEDFSRYVHRFRPEEAESAIRFFEGCNSHCSR